jgi:hypothetical protein
MFHSMAFDLPIGWNCFCPDLVNSSPLSIEDKVPDHSAFSRARNERFRASDIFRSVFERVVGACITAGLVGGEGFAVDASDLDLCDMQGDLGSSCRGCGHDEH